MQSCSIFRNGIEGYQSVQHLEYTPYERHIVASYLLDQVGEDFGEMLTRTSFMIVSPVGLL